MSYADHLDALNARLDDAADQHPTSGTGERRDAWQAVQRDYLAECIGVPLDALDAEERRYLNWLARMDADTTAGVAALIDRAREGAAAADETT